MFFLSRSNLFFLSRSDFFKEISRNIKFSRLNVIRKDEFFRRRYNSFTRTHQIFQERQNVQEHKISRKAFLKIHKNIYTIFQEEKVSREQIKSFRRKKNIKLSQNFVRTDIYDFSGDPQEQIIYEIASLDAFEKGLTYWDSCKKCSRMQKRTHLYQNILEPKLIKHPMSVVVNAKKRFIKKKYSRKEKKTFVYLRKIRAKNLS